MTTVNFVLRDGQVRSAEAHDGDSLMRVAVRNDVPGIEGECGGEMTCATCHVHVPQPWKALLRRPSQEELDILDMAENLTADSRLGCQVRVTADMDGLTATIATMP